MDIYDHLESVDLDILVKILVTFAQNCPLKFFSFVLLDQNFSNNHSRLKRGTLLQIPLTVWLLNGFI